MWQPLIDGCLNPDFKERIQSAKDAIKYVPQNVYGNTDSGANRIITTGTNENVNLQQTGAKLSVMHGDDFGKIFDISQLSKDACRQIITLGRSANSTVMINDQFISRNHSTLETDESRLKWIIRDGQWNFEERIWQKSTNGTFVNSTEVSENGYMLKHGDIVALGDVKLKFEVY
jgi:hypothetical protein